MRKIALALLMVFSLSAMGYAQGADAKARAEDVLKKARAAIADEGKFKGLQSLSANGTSRQVFGERQMESELEIEMMMPDKIRRTTNSSFATIIQALNGDQMWNDFIPNPGMGGGPGGGGGMRVMMGGGGPGGGPGGTSTAMGQYFQLQQRREFVQIMLAWLLTTPPSSQMQYVYVGEAPGPEGSKLDVLDGKSADGIGVRLYFNQEDHKLVGLSYKAKRRNFMQRGPGGGGPGGPGGQRPPQGGQGQQQGQQQGQGGQRQGTQGAQRPEPTPEERERRMKEMAEAFEKAPEVDYRWAFSEYKNVSGFNLPHRITRFEGQNANEEWEISKFKINPKLAADKFVKKEKEKAQ